MDNTIGQAAALYQSASKIATDGVSSGGEDKVSFGSLLKAGVENSCRDTKKIRGRVRRRRDGEG